MLKNRLPVVLAAAAALVVSTAPAAVAAPPDHAPGHVKVATYNLYLGGDIAPLLTAPNILTAASTLWTQVTASNFPHRAKAVAALIAEDRPDVVGLQEVAEWLVTGAASYEVDYLDILQAELVTLGAPYTVAVANTNFVTPVAIPVSASAQVVYTDRDVILVRADLPESRLDVGTTHSHLFTARIPFALTLPTAPPTVLASAVVRGWSSADIELRGQTYTFVNTHLEAFEVPNLQPSIRDLQAAELAGALASSPHPLILVGDLNDDPGVGAADILTDQLGLSDSWTKQQPGHTAGQDDLAAPMPGFDRRIDYVLYEPDETPNLRSVSAHVIGEELTDRTAPVSPSGVRLWPSDHAGVVAMLQARTP